MHVPVSWLAEWVPVPWDATELGSKLTLSGLEVEATEPAAPPFTGVIVAEILEASRHPQADKLQVCRVSTGSGEPVQIVAEETYADTVAILERFAKVGYSIAICVAQKPEVRKVREINVTFAGQHTGAQAIRNIRKTISKNSGAICFAIPIQIFN